MPGAECLHQLQKLMKDVLASALISNPARTSCNLGFFPCTLWTY
jgi:hypothetical protein